ncbi:SDR family NAD(P)-dependent oxidoreductase [Labrys sp. La1]|uniref:SDR family NAD(P)-dependent oxidoreductase n=1 Tax=Labrys sp. La1 TaxID=3404917 RepID=UPI003EBD8587
MDKRVLITAGGSGIGRTMAETFHKAGAHVWAVDADALASCPPVWEREQLDVCDEATVKP